MLKLSSARLVFYSIFLFFFALFATRSAYAIAKFNTSYQVYYKVGDNGVTHVTFIISQKNNLSVVYATEYGISINETKIANLKILDEGQPVIPVINKGQNQTIISFPFAKKVVGKNKVHNFTIEYDTSDIVSKKGNTLQIDIPRFETDENVSDQTAILILPEKFSKPAYIDPKPDIVNNNTYYFSSKVMSNKPISAIFGNNQYFKGKIQYYLENNSSSTQTKTITLVPDTNYQKVYYETIDPKPEKIEVDSDGNLLATYNLQANTKHQIKSTFFVKTDFKSNKTQTNTLPLSTYLSANKIWDHDNIFFTSPEFKNLTSPKSIYDYVANHLHYDYQKINKDGTVRTSSSNSLKNNISATCTDYADVFVSLARRAGIAARELEGFAFSENSELKPISDKQDVLHAWAEYWDENKKSWIQVDPTWGSTTKGLDYFNKLDFNHIVFAIHGVDPLSPLTAGSFKKLGNKEKDITLESIDEIQFPVADIKFENISFNLAKTTIKVTNSSGVYATGQIQLKNQSQTNTKDVTLPPFSSQIISLNNGLFEIFKLKQEPIIITFNGQEYYLNSNHGKTIQKIGFFAIVCLILGLLTLFARSLFLRRRK